MNILQPKKERRGSVLQSIIADSSFSYENGFGSSCWKRAMPTKKSILCPVTMKSPKAPRKNSSKSRHSIGALDFEKDCPKIQLNRKQRRKTLSYVKTTMHEYDFELAQTPATPKSTKKTASTKKTLSQNQKNQTQKQVIDKLKQMLNKPRSNQPEKKRKNQNQRRSYRKSSRPWPLSNAIFCRYIETKITSIRNPGRRSHHIWKRSRLQEHPKNSRGILQHQQRLWKHSRSGRPNHGTARDPKVPTLRKFRPDVPGKTKLRFGCRRQGSGGRSSGRAAPGSDL